MTCPEFSLLKVRNPYRRVELIVSIKLRSINVSCGSPEYKKRLRSLNNVLKNGNLKFILRDQIMGPET